MRLVLIPALILASCAAAVGIVLSSGWKEVSSSALLPPASINMSSPNPQSSADSPVASEHPPSLSGTVSSGVSSVPASSREAYNPSVSSPKSLVLPGGTPLAFTLEEQAALDAMLDGYDPAVSVFFQDIGSGAVYEYDADRHYFVASLIKAPYCMYLYSLAEQGKYDLSALITVTEEDKQEGTGTLKDMEDLPREFTVRELMALAIRHSDNTAMKLLLQKYPAAGYREYAVSIGLEHPDDVRYVVNGLISAHEAGVYLRAIYNYIENGKYGGELKADMLGTSYYMIQSAYPVARKYGWTAGEGKEAYHDMAVVYAPHPYLLAICTNHQKGTQMDRAMFGEISQAFEALWAEKYQSFEK